VARIKDSSVDAVKAATDIVAVVQARTPLKKAGARFSGRCPFHEERTASFSVNPVEKLYHCFGCGAGGDAIKFVQETEQLDFVGAVEWLAERFNVELEYEEGSPEQDARRHRRERLYDVLRQAAGFYERFLWESKAAAFARAYLVQERGLGEEVCRLYGLGYAPGGNALARGAGEKGFSAEELAAAGLVNRRGNDYFSGRLLFPIADARGRIVGFQARIMRADDPLKAKYVNSPEGELFRKGDLLYGLDKARRAISKEDRAIVVEGNPDVLAVRQAGLEPVVAAMGTALTASQLKELKFLRCRRVFLCFDADAAGAAATLRGMELAAGQGFEIRIVTLPPGTDPADAAGEFENHLRSSTPYAVHRVKIALESGESLQERLEGVRKVVAGFEEGSAGWLEAVKHAADALGLSPEAIKRLRGYEIKGEGTISPKVLEADVRRERNALAAAAAHPEIGEALAELPADHFDDERHRRMREALIGERVADDDLLVLRAELDAIADREGITLETGKEMLLRLKERALERELKKAPLERTQELQKALMRLREAFGGLA
jgi:DNA primase